MFISTETECRRALRSCQAVTTLFDLDAVFYGWWGHRASENNSYVQREIADMR